MNDTADTAVASSEDVVTSTWRASDPHVRKLLAFIKKRGGKVNAEDLVAWDRDHGRRLFDWNDPDAAEHWRMHQARVFLNRFRAMFEGMRVRAFIHVREDEAAGIETSSYVSIETITEHPGMRAQVIADITRRMKVLASELKLWKLTAEEQAALFERLADVMTHQQADAA